MIKVKIVDVETNEEFITEMPSIPNKKDTLGIWIDGKWWIMKICYIVHEFDENNKFELVEITVTKTRM